MTDFGPFRGKCVFRTIFFRKGYDTLSALELLGASSSPPSSPTNRRGLTAPAFTLTQLPNSGSSITVGRSCRCVAAEDPSCLALRMAAYIGEPSEAHLAVLQKATSVDRRYQLVPLSDGKVMAREGYLKTVPEY